MKIRLIKTFSVISIIAIIFCNNNGFAQIKESGIESSEDFYIITTTHTDNAGRSGKTVEYNYKGKRYTVDYWASHFMSIVKDSPKAVNQVKKYRSKMIISNALGVTCLGFLIGTYVTSDNSFNLKTAGIGLVTGTAAKIIANSRSKNIIKAADHYEHSNKTSMIDQNYHNRFYMHSIKDNSSQLFTVKFKFNF